MTLKDCENTIKIKTLFAWRLPNAKYWGIQYTVVTSTLHSKQWCLTELKEEAHNVVGPFGFNLSDFWKEDVLNSSQEACSRGGHIVYKIWIGPVLTE